MKPRSVLTSVSHHCVGRIFRSVRHRLLLACLLLPFAGFAEDLGNLSLEDLTNIKVTSVSKKEEELDEAAAAIFVLTNDDLRRSGFTTAADALRLVPGLQVASIGSNSWAVSARGFNSQFSNKLLVMIDGRSVYSPLFSGVYWDAQQVFLEDVDRIEVIRGPGATIWGANAVNGVINILSKSARDTQGGLIYGSGGDSHLTSDGARYGGRIGEDTYYRIYGSYQLNDNFKLTNGLSARDGWDIGQSGFRVDRYPDKDSQLTWQGDYYSGNLFDHRGDLFGVNTLGRWKQRISERSSYEVQAYFDHTYRNDDLAANTLDTVDVSWQHTFGLGEHNDIIWGLGYRFTDARLKSNSPGLTIIKQNIPLNLFSAFIQDEWKIIPGKLTFTVGTKIEYTEYTGLELEPGARLSYKLAENQTVWAAVSRAVRTPSESEGENAISFALGPPAVGPGGGLYVPTLLGNTRLESEVLWAYELGYRIQPTHRTSVDIAAFYNDYTSLTGQTPTGAFISGAPVGIMPIELTNALRGNSYGGEAVFTVAATDSWRLSANYSLLTLHVRGGTATENRALESNAPEHQFVLRSSYDFTRQAGLDAQLRYVDSVTGIPAYVTADVRLSYRPTANLEFSLVGQNLLQARHPEQASLIGAYTTEVPRSVMLKITWHF